MEYQFKILWFSATISKMDHSDFKQRIHIQQAQIDVLHSHHIKIPALSSLIRQNVCCSLFV